MKSRDGLIRLKRFQVREKRRQVAQIEAMIAEFERMAKDLNDQVVAEQERSGGAMLDAESASSRQEPVHGGAVETSGAPQAVGTGHSRQELEVDLLCEPSKCAVADVLCLVQHSRFQVVGHQSNHLLAHVEAVDGVNVQAIEQAQRRRDAGLFVIERANPSIDEGGCWRLAEVVADGREHHR